MGFLKNFVATALAVGFVGGVVPPASASSGGHITSPIIDGVCEGYTRHNGDLPCQMLVEYDGDIVHVTDGYNTYTYVRGWIPNTYQMYTNGEQQSMKICTLDNYEFNCLTSIHFVPSNY